MPNISFTDLVDVISKSGTPKATKVTQIKNRMPYHPATDFYKPLRDGLIDIHSSNKEKPALFQLLFSITDQKKIGNYSEIIEGYRKWWGRKNITWFEPPRTTYSYAGIELAINPELGLIIDGARHIVKLYLKSDPLSKLRIDLATVLMEVTLRPHCQANDSFIILDARKSHQFTVTASIKQTLAVVDAELSYIAALWPKV